MLAIETTGLAKTYSGLFGRGGREALRGVDLAIEEGAAFGLIGLNGAGKTTFIKSLLGIVRPTSGVVRVLGGDPEDPRTRARIGYLPERLHLPHAWTPLAFLASVARLKGLGRADHDVRAELARVGLEGDAERRIGQFSKGMKQRLGLAAALLGAPALLVLDEPTDGVDPLGRAAIRALLAEERARGATLFLNSHLLSETERICDRIGVLSGGRLVRSGGLDELCRATSRYRVRFAGEADANALAALGFVAGDEEHLYRCQADDPAALNALLDRARAGGALLVELTADLRDLEDVLAEAVVAAPAREALA